MDKQFVCSICGNSFNLNIYLRRHVKKHHPDVEVNAIAPRLAALLNYKYKCMLCDRNFNFINQLRFHERKKHGLGLISVDNIKKFKCPLCDYLTREKKHLFIHIESEHNLSITSAVLEFPSFEDFTDWKKCIERETLSLYILNTGSKQTYNKSITRHYFSCHRSGYYNTKGKGKRLLKTQGSKKINGTCPASIQVVQGIDGKCIVRYTPTHVGHENDIHHLSLTKSERENLAIDIANKVPFETILDRVRSSVSESGLARIHLLTKKDLYNIEQNNTHHLPYELNDNLEETTVYTEEVIESNGILFIDTKAEEKTVELCDEEEDSSYFSLELLNKKEKVREALLQLADNVLTFTDNKLEIVIQDISLLEEKLKTIQDEIDHN